MHFFKHTDREFKEKKHSLDFCIGQARWPLSEYQRRTRERIAYRGEIPMCMNAVR